VARLIDDDGVGAAATVAVRAAGGVVWRVADPGPAGPGGPEVLVVHRPAPRDDWTLPKGKLDDGEDWAAAAVREVAEETGLACILGDEVGEVRYRDGKGRPKAVRYWLMRPLDPSAPLRPHDPAEVDAVAWCPLADLGARLTYPTDRTVVDAAADLLVAATDPHRRHRPPGAVADRATEFAPGSPAGNP
jgi:8-oxo-dGTP diphosphatase